jgi:hypothetical protein
MLDMEKYMESYKESISKRFEKQEENFENKMKTFEVTQIEYKNRLSRLEDRIITDENEDIELQQVKNFELYVIFPIFRSASILKPFHELVEIKIKKTVGVKRDSREIRDSLLQI